MKLSEESNLLTNVSTGRAHPSSALPNDGAARCAENGRALSDSGSGEHRNNYVRSALSVADIVHNRAFAGPDLSTVHVLCTVETRDQAHIIEITDLLTQEGVRLSDNSQRTIAR
ncbi:MAG: hypothetical protein HY735_23670 [Verrucomicrobia bacterium]|nr:hypothetical protein [Verrucomicrobiota bacterium]